MAGCCIPGTITGGRMLYPWNDNWWQDVVSLERHISDQYCMDHQSLQGTQSLKVRSSAVGAADFPHGAVEPLCISVLYTAGMAGAIQEFHVYSMNKTGGRRK